MKKNELQNHKRSHILWSQNHTRRNQFRNKRKRQNSNRSEKMEVGKQHY